MGSRITPLRLYNHQKDENFDTFQARAERLIGAANFPVLTVDQIAILFHVDRMTNRYLKEEVQKDFDNIFTLTYDQALHRFRHFHNVLRKSKTKQYTGMGEGPVVKKLQNKKNLKHVGQIGQGDSPVVCFKCGVKGHISKLCKTKINPCNNITTCNSQTHNLEGHRAM